MPSMPRRVLMCSQSTRGHRALRFLTSATPLRPQHISHACASMICLLGIFGVVLGVIVASMADRQPQREARMEMLGGLLLIAGFALLGYSLDSNLGLSFGFPRSEPVATHLRAELVA